ncbi:hypothetical protein CK203_070812 [Vitis vinifera]|uniref:DUF7356 domain-containing protein n=1 Tax=Vitis vinifera TaxID=29760 RepID=A0A438E421_VITVI|nr:hypothetical protein CK203_070812 [Vitis vinifera]
MFIITVFHSGSFFSEKLNDLFLVAPMELFLLVNNDGEGTLEVDVTISPVDSTLKDIQIPKIQIPKHQMKKVCFLSFTLVMLYVLPQSGHPFSAHRRDMGLLQVGKKERQVDGVPYQELEMGQPDSLSTIHVETAEGWDRGWDDDWDEENAVKSPGGNNVANGSANGHTSKSSGKGWMGR